MKTLTCIVLLANFILAQAFYSASDDVSELTPLNFGPAILDTDQLVAVEFYAPWCGHCQRLVPEWKKAATNLKGIVNIAAINCDEENNKGLCAMYEIKGFPTIKVFSPELKKNKKTGKLTKEPSDYQGPRDAKAIVDYLLSHQPSNVQFVKWNEKDVKSKKSISHENFLATKNETLPKALLFTNKPNTTPLYKALSVDFKNRMLVGEVKQNEKNILAEYAVDSFPTLLVISPDHGVVRFEGKLNRESLKSFLSKYALPVDEGKQKANAPKPKTDAPKKQVVPKTVIEIDSDEVMNSHCLGATVEKNTICVLAITGDDDKKETVDTLTALVKKAVPSEVFSFEYGWIHADQAKKVMDTLQLPMDYPSFVFVHPSKKLYRNFIGSSTVDHLYTWLKQVGSGNIQAWPYKSNLKINEKPVYEEEIIEEAQEAPARDEL